MIYFQMHIMWYEKEIVREVLDSIFNAASILEGLPIKFHFGFNHQTYIEKPSENNIASIFEELSSHPLFDKFKVKITNITDDQPFYNIADWRREMYDPSAKYTVWGETDCLLPIDFFFILNELNVDFKHILTLASRPMWDNSWDIVTHSNLQGYSKPCKCENKHRSDCIELLEAPLKYKDTITQSQLDSFNQQFDIKVESVPNLKIDGSLLCISSNMETPFISPQMHFVREDTCAEYFFKAKKIPQLCIKTRIKGHNYKHPLKRTNTVATRNDEVFKKYASESQKAMQTFLKNL